MAYKGQERDWGIGPETCESERAVKCTYCGMRGASGSREALYWWTRANGRKVLRHEDGTVHNLVCTSYKNPYRGKSPRPIDPSEIRTEEVRPVVSESHDVPMPPKPVEVVEPIRTTADDASLIEVLRKALGNSVDEDQVRSIVNGQMESQVVELKEAFAEALNTINVPTRVVIEHAELPDVDLGVTHELLPEILEDVRLGLNVWMVGPAGNGKTTIAKQVAKALGIEYYSIGLTATKPISDILGYRGATGEYHSTAFRQAWEHGGVILFDECDNGNPNTLGCVSEAMDSDSMQFPDARVARHADFHLIAAANTYGNGPDRRYVGRNQLDAAFLDRFGSYIDLHVDLALETHIARAMCEDVELADRWVRYVRQVRGNVEQHKLPIVVGPRASRNGARMLGAGQAWERVIAKCLRKGVTDADWSKIAP